MPFKSKAQERLMFAKNPALARRFLKHTKSVKDLPERKNSKDSNERGSLNRK